MCLFIWLASCNEIVEAPITSGSCPTIAYHPFQWCVCERERKAGCDSPLSILGQETSHRVQKYFSIVLEYSNKILKT